MKIFGFYITKVNWFDRHQALKEKYFEEKTRQMRVLGILNTMIITRQLFYWKNMPIMVDHNLKLLLEDLRDYLRGFNS